MDKVIGARENTSHQIGLVLLLNLIGWEGGLQKSKTKAAQDHFR